MAKFKIEAVVPVYLEAEFELDSSELADAQKKIEESVFIEAEDDETTGTFIRLGIYPGKGKEQYFTAECYPFADEGDDDNEGKLEITQIRRINDSNLKLVFSKASNG